MKSKLLHSVLLAFIFLNGNGQGSLEISSVKTLKTTTAQTISLGKILKRDSNGGITGLVDKLDLRKPNEGVYYIIVFVNITTFMLEGKDIKMISCNDTLNAALQLVSSKEKLSTDEGDFGPWQLPNSNYETSYMSYSTGSYEPRKFEMKALFSVSENCLSGARILIKGSEYSITGEYIPRTTK